MITLFTVCNTAFFISEEDLSTLSEYRFYLNYNKKTGHKYIDAYSNGKKKLLHKILCPNFPYIDHKDGNGLNNIRENLRGCSQRQNMHNAKSHKRSGYKGISFDSTRNKWAASIRSGGKNLFLGRFSSELEAATVYNKAAEKIQGEFAYHLSRRETLGA